MFFWELGQSDDAQIHGITFVQDMAKYSMWQMRAGVQQNKEMSSKQRKAASMSQDAMPIKYGAFFIVDAPWYFGIIWTIIRPFMKRKLRERVQFIKRRDLSKLHAAVPKGSLPPSLGGSLNPQHDKWWWVPPSRRPAVPPTASAMEGDYARDFLL